MSESFHLPAPPGFQGLRDDLPLRWYVRRLPHWRQQGASYFVTFRLGDALPEARVRELRELIDDWRHRHPDATREEWDAVVRDVRTRTERWLDAGHGGCELGIPECAGIVRNSMHHFDGVRYELCAYVVMPNHVHVVVRPFDGHELETVLQSWKRFTAAEINRTVGAVGSRWQDESFDRIVRDEEHLWRVVQYVGRNPRMAGLDPRVIQPWIRPEWAPIGWQFVDEGNGGSGGLKIRPTDATTELRT